MKILLGLITTAVQNMPLPFELRYDAATGLALGQRLRQEDAVAHDFTVGAPHGFAVLADGMGGHAAGDLASQIAVTEMFSELKMRSCDAAALESNIQHALTEAIEEVNLCIADVAEERSEEQIGQPMGSTLVAPIFFGNRLYWISVGDSPLFLFRDNSLVRLNEDHSAAADIDQMCAEGLIDQQEAQTHPDRNCLTSVLIGDDIPRVDCSADPTQLRPGDIVLAASDGLLFLHEQRIKETLEENQDRASAEIVSALLHDIEALHDPEQDNVSICLIKLDIPGLPKTMRTAPTVSAANLAKKPGTVTVLAHQNGKSTNVFCVSKSVKI
ncbi:MAG: protein phosphatase 2C domain-containing protein [Pseudomonadota bacterium]